MGRRDRYEHLVVQGLTLKGVLDAREAGYSGLSSDNPRVDLLDL